MIVSDSPALSCGPFSSSRDITLIDSVKYIIDTIDWRTHLIAYLHNPSVKTDRGIRQMAFKYVLIDNELYHRTPSDILLKCLGLDDATLVMAEVHQGICGTLQSTPKMKWVLR
jgi:hypothetical protein